MSIVPNSGKNKESTVGLIILAAGASSRLGEPKQLLKLNDQTLIFRAVRTGLRSLCFPVLVILGANAELIMREIEDLPVYINKNPNWKKGMGNSLKYGLDSILRIYPHLDAVVVMLCDQPFVDGVLLNELIRTYYKTGSLVVASEYEHHLGVPALFDKTLFPELAKLKGDKGARNIIKSIPHTKISSVPFALGKIDIDCYEDYFLTQQLINK
ncbi:nucleotidyltransferase family protein [Fulvivirgaceae bacterium BMA10]|uniref:Nucleotidyltransferase family protein n=1 Tax=Splendidivirga corallicola TaxID=3051826 RepID=A0ABT8KQN8_9BACT|nr:nucleotidyltransferase family protein [Fulvivirgaceae bacterium BMA10]